MSLFSFDFFIGLLFLLPELAVFAACGYYFLKTKSTDSVLLSIGSLASICIMGFYKIIFPIMSYAGAYNWMPGDIMFKFTSIVGFFGSCLFAAGLFMLVVKYLKDRNKTV